MAGEEFGGTGVRAGVGGHGVFRGLEDYSKRRTECAVEKGIDRRAGWAARFNGLGCRRIRSVAQ